MRLFYTLAFYVLGLLSLNAQTDTRFWFAAPEVSAGHGDAPILLRFVTFNTPATITISIPSNPAFTPVFLTVPANSSQSIDLTTNLALIETPHNAIANTGLLVQSTGIITAYYEVNRSNNPDIFALKGRNALGTSFFMPFQNKWKHQAGLVPKGHTAAIVVATEDGTNVTFTPTKNIVYGGVTIRSAGVPFTIALNKGQTYSLSHEEPIAANIATGTKIDSNKAIAVTLSQDSENTAVGGCYDLSGDQLVPTNIIGQEYIIMRGFLGFDGTNPYTNNHEYAFITATQDGTIIQKNGTTVSTINTGQTFAITLTNTDIRTYVYTSKPAYVMHYSGYGCEVGAAILPPIICTGSRNVKFVRSTNEHFGVNLMVPKGFHDDFKLNGVAIPAASFSLVPGTTNWMSAQITYSTTAVAVGVASQITNDSSLFHMGLINGGASSGCRYGYFSSFNGVNLGPDINVSYGSTITLDAGTIFGVSYLWSTGETTQSITVGLYGEYWVQVNLGNCQIRDTVCVGTNEYIWQGTIDRSWNNVNNWSRPCGINAPPSCMTDVVIQNGKPRYPLINSLAECRDILIEDAADISFTSTGKLDICGNVDHKGAINTVAGSIQEFKGTTPQEYKASATANGYFENVRINNTTFAASNYVWAYVKLPLSSIKNFIISQTGTLTFMNGCFATEGDKEIVLLNRSPLAITGHTLDKFIVGRIRRSLLTLGSYDFPVGLANDNTPPTTPVVAGKTGTLTNMNTAGTGLYQGWLTNSYCGNNSTILRFDGIDDYVALPTSVCPTGSAARTVEAWVYVDQFKNGAVFDFGNSGVNLQEFCLKTRAATDGWRLQLGGATNIDFTIASSGTSWHHVAVTYDGSAVKCYFDGNLVVNFLANLNTQNTSRTLGKDGTNFFKGRIDELKIWNYARTQAEIQGFMCTKFSCQSLIPPSIIAYYDFEEGIGSNSINFKNIVCFPPNLSYQLANVEFTVPTTTDNLLGYFRAYGSIPGPTGQLDICGADFNTCDALNNGFWTLHAYNASMVQVPGDGFYNISLYNRDYTNACGSGTTVMKRSNSGSVDPWLIPTGTSFCASNIPSFTKRNSMQGFSIFATAQSAMDVILPVNLLSLNAIPNERDIDVVWSTAGEQNNEGFSVLRSANGTEFLEIGFVKGKGTTQNVQSYVFKDEKVLPNQMYYYKLKQVDSDGTISLSPIVQAKILSDNMLPELGEIKLYPNPSDGIFTIDAENVFMDRNTPITFKLTNSHGIILWEKQTNFALDMKIHIDLSTLPSGLYLLECSIETKKQTLKLIKR